jgi:methylmalonyl-CoA/ethylmalonyl-CoA epimerase
MIIDHIGIVVECLCSGIPHWEKTFGYQQMTEMVMNTRQKVNVVFLKKENSLMVKLIEPIDETSPIYRFAKKGGGIHHICFKCSNLDSEIQRLKCLGLRVLSEPQPGEAFDNEAIAFIYAKQGIYVELIDTEKRAMKILDSKTLA